MPRIIQDSDDEDDVAIDAVIAAAIVSPAKAAELTAAVDVKVSAPAVEPQALQTPHLRGTSSSGTFAHGIIFPLCMTIAAHGK